jgi:hypothetical protein
MADKTDQTDDLDLMLRKMRVDTLPSGLSDRILADAMTVQGQHLAPLQVRPAPESGMLRQILNALGGWPAMGGLLAACAAGVWIGMAAPALDPSLFGNGTDDVDFTDGYNLSLMLSEDI